MINKLKTLFGLIPFIKNIRIPRFIKYWVGFLLSKVVILKAEKLREDDYRSMKDLFERGEANCAILSDMDDITGLGIVIFTGSIYTHSVYYNKDDHKIYHSTADGSLKENLEHIYHKYNSALLMKIDREIVIDPAEVLGKEYDYNLDYEDHSQLNCVELVKIIFGITDPECKWPIHLKRYASKTWRI
jgi:hypothetical protein